MVNFSIDCIDSRHICRILSVPFLHIDPYYFINCVPINNVKCDCHSFSYLQVSQKKCHYFYPYYFDTHKSILITFGGNITKKVGN